MRRPGAKAGAQGEPPAAAVRRHILVEPASPLPDMPAGVRSAAGAKQGVLTGGAVVCWHCRPHGGVARGLPRDPPINVQKRKAAIARVVGTISEASATLTPHGARPM